MKMHIQLKKKLLLMAKSFSPLELTELFTFQNGLVLSSCADLNKELKMDVKATSGFRLALFLND